MTKLIFALDVPDAAEATRWVNTLHGVVCWYKVGLELYLREGAGLVKKIRDMGNNIFLDLKLHDIPATVERAASQAALTGASMMTVHASGGVEMMKAAVRGVEAADNPPKIVAVTVLTSLDAIALKAVGLRRSPSKWALDLAAAAKVSGAAGIVCSPNEIKKIKKLCGENFLAITPGIRMPGSVKDDQRRTATPEQASQWGADFIVVGRPIRNAADPVAAAKAIINMLR